MATFRKTQSGEWVVFGPAQEVKPGRVNVRKADGSTKSVTVESVGKPFDVNGTPHVYGKLAAQARTSENRSSPKPCAECGRPGATTLCYDSSGIGGYCCPRCSRMSRYERSFA